MAKKRRLRTYDEALMELGKFIEKDILHAKKKTKSEADEDNWLFN